MGTAAQTGPPSPALIFETLRAFERSAALGTAIELDLFRAVGEGPGDVASIARKCSCSERGIRILCDYLTIGGFLDKRDGKYSNTPAAAVFLDSRSPSCVGSISKFLLNPLMTAPFAQLTDIVRHGRTSMPGEGSVEPDNPVWVEFARSMAPMMAPMAGPFAEAVLDGLSGPVRVLDVAAGHGLFGIGVAKRNPEARIVAQDWAAVLAVAKANADKAGVGERYELLPGSAFDVDYGGPCDAVLLTNFLHHFDVATCVTLLRKVHAALKPGGRAVTLDFVPNEDRVSPAAAAAFSMVMLASTPAGDAYTFRELEGMYREAGFAEVSAQALPGGSHTVVTGTR